MELTSRISLTYAKTKHCLLSPFSTTYCCDVFYLLSAADLLGMFGKNIKGQKFPLLSQEPNIVHF